MMKRAAFAVALTGALLLSACGRGENTPGQPSADERKALDNVARKLDEQGTIDTSPDSLVPADEAAVTGNGIGVAPGNAAAPAVTSTNETTKR